MIEYYHIKRALELAEKYEKEGNKARAKRFLEIAEKYEGFLKEQEKPKAKF